MTKGTRDWGDVARLRLSMDVGLCAGPDLYPAGPMAGTGQWHGCDSPQAGPGPARGGCASGPHQGMSSEEAT